MRRTRFFFEIDEFIDDESVQEGSTQPTFYRFINQIRNLSDALNCDDQSHPDTCDLQPQLYIPEPRENIDFNDCDESTKLSDKFKKTLRAFEDVDKEDSFFAAVLFSLLTKLSKMRQV